MAITRVEGLSNPVGSLKEVYVDVDGPSSYATGGQTINAQDVGLRQIVAASGGASDNGAQHVQPAHASKGTLVSGTPAGGSVKLLWFVASTGAEVAAAVNLSGRFARIRVVGR